MAAFLPATPCLLLLLLPPPVMAGRVRYGAPGHCFPSCLVLVVVALSCAQAIMYETIRLAAADYAGQAAGGLCWWGGVGGAVFHVLSCETEWIPRSGSRRFRFDFSIAVSVSCHDGVSWGVV